MKKLFFLIVVSIICNFNLQVLLAQDIHFTQFYATPMSLNPAETGFFDANWRFTNNYRTQWSAIGIPYKTISAGIDKPFKLKNKKKSIGLGVFFINDQSGSSMLTVNKLFISSAYITTIDDLHHISIGLQVGYIVKSFSLNGITFPSQYNNTSGLFDEDMPNNLTNWHENITYPDINFGINYKGDFTKMKPFVGFSVFHINTPSESFLKTKDKLPIRFVINGGLEYSITDKLILRPHLLSMYHKRASNWLLSTLVYYNLGKEKFIEKVFGGLQARTVIETFDAVIFTGGINLYGFDIGISYDVNISRLRAATNNRGAFEISLIFKDFSKALDRVALPCDRY